VTGPLARLALRLPGEWQVRWMGRQLASLHERAANGGSTGAPAQPRHNCAYACVCACECSGAHLVVVQYGLVKYRLLARQQLPLTVNVPASIGAFVV
jgi:hypothetical protein